MWRSCAILPPRASGSLLRRSTGRHNTGFPMSSPPRQVFIHGITLDGRTFRPSDWAERLCGAMASFRPPEAAAGGIGAFIGYSPYCVPRVIHGVKCVIVNEKLRDIEPMAWDFVIN